MGKPLRIGLALSGGGVRAAGFHLGVLQRLAVAGRLEEVEVISTVSGGSICIGLVYSHNNMKWPSSSEFLEAVLPEVFNALSARSLQAEVVFRVVLQVLLWLTLVAPLWRLLSYPFLFFGRRFLPPSWPHSRALANLGRFPSRTAVLSDVLRTRWGVTGPLAAVSRAGTVVEPTASADDTATAVKTTEVKVVEWIINATCYETGKSWRFEPCYRTPERGWPLAPFTGRMGDYQFGYTRLDSFLLSDALAASAGFPFLIGPLVIEADVANREWYEYETKYDEAGCRLGRVPKPLPQPRHKKAHLWDGGVYDNMGLESLFRISEKWQHHVDFLIASDVSGMSREEDFSLLKTPSRLTAGIMMNQIRALRSRSFINRCKNRWDGNRGALLRIGKTCKELLSETLHCSEIPVVSQHYLTQEDVLKVSQLGTTLKRLKKDTLSSLIRHGFETADCVLYGYNDDLFDLLKHAPVVMNMPKDPRSD